MTRVNKNTMNLPRVSLQRGGSPVRIATITPTSGDQFVVRVYEADHAARLRLPGLAGSTRSSGVTFPSVTSRILRITAADGRRSPLMYRLMDAVVMPTEFANSVCDIPRCERKSASLMPNHYHDGNDCQAVVALSVSDARAARRYHLGMSADLGSIIVAAKMSQAKVAQLVGVSAPVLNRWCKDHRSVPDDKAIRLAEILGKTPFDINPDFNKTAFDGIKDVDEREETRLRMKRAYRYQAAREPTIDAPIERPRKVRTK